MQNKNLDRYNFGERGVAGARRITDPDLIEVLNQTGAFVRIANGLMSCHVSTLAELKELDPRALLKGKNLGQKSVRALIDAGVWPGVTMADVNRRRSSVKEAQLKASIAGPREPALSPAISDALRDHSVLLEKVGDPLVAAILVLAARIARSP